MARSPFNIVKLELAIILCGGVVMWLGIEQWIAHHLLQVTLMAGYGVMGMLWLMARTRRIVRRQQSAQAGGGDGTQ